MIYSGSLIDGVVEILEKRSTSEYGTFRKFFVYSNLAKDNVLFETKEAYSIDSEINVIRGIHFQTTPSQGKIITVERGRFFMVGVDLRIESDTFSKWMGIDMSQDTSSIYVPRGIGIGSLCMDRGTLLIMCDSEFDDASNGGIIWNDRDIGIEWPIENGVRYKITERDKSLGSLKEYIRNNKGKMII